MADEFDWDEDDDNPPSNNSNGTNDKAPKGLRAHAKKLDEENKALKARLDDLERTARKDRVTKAVTAKGFDPAVADVIPDAVASDDSALDKWLTEKEALFAKQVKQEEQLVPTGYDDGDELEEDAEGYMRLARVSQGSLPASKNADIRAAIASAKTREEMDELLRKHGNKNIA